ncbi:ANTAR domain-containing protein [Streptomyces armeniacus]|uniref:ANTAR domain-containing protein n=1 Tax=Streptomyces armeniacus TaxID=83291 RepID=A0A345Y0J4_9ACTN|nr:ANTAR domain-containing protein [Streptomyces armeniacus]AXK37410.1 ANTAR domain-containing protein [Streptomyces armeniacus]
MASSTSSATQQRTPAVPPVPEAAAIPIGDSRSAVGEVGALRAEITQLREAMDSRAVIDQARGMLMALAPCSSEAAWDLLVEISQRSNVKLRDVSAALVASAAGEPSPPEIQKACRRALA